MIKLNPYEKTILLLLILKAIEINDPGRETIYDSMFFNSLGRHRVNEEEAEKMNKIKKDLYDSFLNSYLFEGIDVRNILLDKSNVISNKLNNYFVKLFSESEFFKELGFDKYIRLSKYEMLNDKDNLFFCDLAKSRKEIKFGFELTIEEVKEFSYFLWKMFDNSSNSLKESLIIMKKFYESNKRMNKFIQVLLTDLFLELNFSDSSYKLMLPLQYHIDFSMIDVIPKDQIGYLFSNIFLKDDPVYQKLKSIDFIGKKCLDYESL